MHYSVKFKQKNQSWLVLEIRLTYYIRNTNILTILLQEVWSESPT